MYRGNMQMFQNLVTIIVSYHTTRSYQICVCCTYRFNSFLRFSLTL